MFVETLVFQGNVHAVTISINGMKELRRWVVLLIVFRLPVLSALLLRLENQLPTKPIRT